MVEVYFTEVCPRLRELKTCPQPSLSIGMDEGVGNGRAIPLSAKFNCNSRNSLTRVCGTRAEGEGKDTD